MRPLRLTKNGKFELGPLGAFELTNKEEFTLGTLGPSGPFGPLKSEGPNSGPWALTTSEIPVKKKSSFQGIFGSRTSGAPKKAPFMYVEICP